MKRLMYFAYAAVAVLGVGGIVIAATTGSSSSLSPPYLGSVLEGTTGNIKAEWHDANGDPVIIDEVVSWQFKVGSTVLYTGGPLTPVVSNITLLAMPTLANRVVDEELPSERRRFSAIGRIGSEYIPLNATYDVINNPDMVVDPDTGIPEFFNP